MMVARAVFGSARAGVRWGSRVPPPSCPPPPEKRPLSFTSTCPPFPSLSLFLPLTSSSPFSLRYILI
ncbi:hypothetical protein E2C01_093106 [Portunus trituberculatus]|uniref:Uncharacterized protein n=1 Tax=Portunus trituberculatus TaxID=210409 RepID=A0A5B7JZN5_PORTR|nr:hypothetical protein [Portunus trituberculatus]